MPKKILFLISLAILSIFTYIAYPEIKEYQTIHSARKVIKSNLKDPASAKYNNEVASKDKTVVCGEVNSKNSLGGYVGFKRYLVRGNEIAFEGNTLMHWNLTGGKIKPTESQIMMFEYSEKPESTEPTISQARQEVFKWLWANSCNQA